MKEFRLGDHWIPMLGLCLLSILYLVFFADFMAYPMEDAAMLIRYAEHWAAGHGIVWNIGETPLDGATDFLFLAFMAGMIKLGVDHLWAVRILGLLSHFAGIGLVYWMLAGRFKTGQWLAFLAALAFAMGNGIGYIEGGFGTTFFGFWVLLSLDQALRIWFGRGRNWPPSVGFALACLAMGLTRPEGVFMAVFLLIGLLSMGLKRPRKATLLAFGCLFMGLGAAYFALRWAYFDSPFPNPFYIKSGGTLHLQSLKNAIKQVLIQGHLFLLPLIWAWTRLFGWRLSPNKLKKPLFSLGELTFSTIPLLGFTLIWLLIKDEMNYLGRFQYPIFCLLLVVWAFFLKDIKHVFNMNSFFPKSSSGNRKKWMTAGLVLLAIVAPLAKGLSLPQRFHARDGRFAVAQILEKYKQKGYTLVATEAGTLPLYSEWISVDAWGLNDRKIAHEGSLTREYLDERSPEVILIHDWKAPREPLPENPKDKWGKMCKTLHLYALENQYLLAACYGFEATNVHYYYVKPGFEDEKEIVKAIREVDYVWPGNGEMARDFALEE